MRRLGWGRTALGVAVLLAPVVVESGETSSAAAGAIAGEARWERTSAGPALPRYGATAVAVGGGFLVFGGRPLFRCPDNGNCGHQVATGNPDAALYDPAVDAWLPAAPPGPVEPRSVVESDGVVYAYGWVPEPGTSSAELVPFRRRLALLAYDPAIPLWSTLPIPPRDPVCLDDGTYRQGCWEPRLLDAGGRLVAIRRYGSAGPALSVYDQLSLRWHPLPDPDARADFFTGAAWAAGRLWMTGARGAKRFLVGLDLRSRRWTSPVSVAGCARGPQAVAGLVVWPGCGVFDPATRRYRRAPAPPKHTAADPPVPDGLVVGNRVTFRGHLFDPLAGTYIRQPDPPDPRIKEPAYAAADGVLFRFGGSQHYYGSTGYAYVLHLPAKTGPGEEATASADATLPLRARLPAALRAGDRR